ncbi:hypothetical protein FSP39_010720 [Pinctada imbricata]|uniref:Fucosyltransferase n=1 Tax=Pinctada imbricata TaxID=66713 RepID=A0AA89C3B4_PINIB|nr:hypothetical protein FSP39_010720 [Pinctada imbricata]
MNITMKISNVSYQNEFKRNDREGGRNPVHHGFLLQKDRKQMRSENIRNSLGNDEEETASPAILYWNPPSWFNKEHFLRQSHQGNLLCKDKCKVTFDRNRLDDADAVIFDIRPKAILPEKKIGQIWILSAMESPEYSHNDMKGYDGKFNWTWTYRRDSDILKMYGSLNVRENPISSDDVSEILKVKTGYVLWLASHCFTSSKREVFVRKLQKYIDIDIFGRCGTMTCPKTNRTCTKSLLYERYKFYLSFENSMCRDYITEKLFRALKYNIIPVARGGYNISLFVPQDSYINVKDAHVVGDLNDILLEVSGNTDIYAKYLNWKRFYESTFHIQFNWCDLCHRVVNKWKYQRLYTDIKQWWWGSNSSFGNACY